MNNSETVNRDNDSKKILTMVILIATLMICTTSATYAYFALTATNSVANGTVASASLTLTVTEASLGGTSSGSTKTGKMVPQRESALGTAMGSTYACVDANGNTVCKVYTITVTNGSSAAVKVVGTIQFSGNESMPNLKFKRTTSTTAVGSYTAAVGTNTTNTYDLIATTGATCVVASGTCTTASLAASSGSATYYIVVWIDAPMSGTTEQSQTDSGSWIGTITFQGENGTGVTSTITS